MYSPNIVDRNVAKVSDLLGIKLVHYGDGKLEEMNSHLTSLVKEFDDYGRPKHGAESLFRPLTEAETAYITNERLLCKFDFRYYATRYAHIKLADEAGESARVGRMGRFMKTQEMLLSKMAIIEESVYDAYDRGEPVGGLWFLIHKARQTGFTAFCRMATQQKTTFSVDQGNLAASIDETLVHELFDRDKILYSNLPWFLKPGVKDDVKDTHFTFGDLNSGTVYHQSNQKVGLGTGTTVTNVHLTECALWASAGGAPGKIEFSLLPAIHKSVTTLVLLESTADGYDGYWYPAVKTAEKGKGDFHLLFCPWYAADRRYRAQPPPGWEPMEVTKAMIDMVERTSHTFLGTTIRLDKYQSFYWEDRFLMHKERKNLNSFYANYPTTVDESFKHSTGGAFPIETITELRMGLGKLVGAYDLEMA